MNCYREFRRMGELLFKQGLVSLAAGNLSVRNGNSIFITASGSFLGDLKWSDIAEVPLEPGPAKVTVTLQSPASVETVVHRNIYLNTSHKAVAHGHGPYALALSSESERIFFDDGEGRLSVPEIPVISCREKVGSDEVAAAAGANLKNFPAIVIRGHGIFAAAGSLKNACALLSTIEFSSKIKILREIYGRIDK